MRRYPAKTIVPRLAVVLLLAAACRSTETGTVLGDAYTSASRPEVWKLLPRGEAERVGLQPGDVLLSYNQAPVQSNDDVRVAQAQALGADSTVGITVLRDEAELDFRVKPGPLGAVPVSGRYPSSLALALDDILRHFGRFSDYDWLAALTGESFTFTANDSECAAWWPGGLAGDYLGDVCKASGLVVRQVFDADDSTDPLPVIRGELAQGQVVLVQGGWPEHRYSFWGIATGYNDSTNQVTGYTLDAASELPLTGTVYEAYVLSPSARGWDGTEELVRQVLQQVLEANQTRVPTGWKSGIDAYDQLIVSLEQVPFCPTCDTAESRACFDRLVWSMVAHRESAIRFLEQVREVLPEQADIIDDMISSQRAIVGKLEGLIRSGVRVGTVEDQRKVGMVIAAIELTESDLLGLYESLLAEL